MAWYRDEPSTKPRRGRCEHGTLGLDDKRGDGDASLTNLDETADVTCHRSLTRHPPLARNWTPPVPSIRPSRVTCSSADRRGSRVTWSITRSHAPSRDCGVRVMGK